MGFFRFHQEKIAARLLGWQYQRMNMPAPPAEDLARQAKKLVDDAHRIARERGRNVMSILKELVADIRK